MKTLCIIPARSGSKRLKNKNFLSFDGIPLVMRAVAMASPYVDKVIVSVSDFVDQMNLRIFTDGFKNVEVWIRPNELSTDDATSDDVALYHVNEMDRTILAVKEEPYDTIIYMQCTSPLFGGQDLARMLDIFFGNDIDALATANHHIKFSGACIIIKKDAFLKNRSFWLPKMAIYMVEKDSDIDDLSDFRIAEAYARGNVYGSGN